jgi:hypothetical protein
MISKEGEEKQASGRGLGDEEKRGKGIAEYGFKDGEDPSANPFHQETRN